MIELVKSPVKSSGIFKAPPMLTMASTKQTCMSSHEINRELQEWAEDTEAERWNRNATALSTGTGWLGKIRFHLRS
jgi:hypothetical protein